MNSGPNRILDEFAKLMTDAAGVAQGVRGEAETAFKSQAERFLAGMDLVKRDEFDIVRKMAIKALDENERLGERIKELEAKISALESAEKPKAKSPAKKAGRATSKKTSAKSAQK